MTLTQASVWTKRGIVFLILSIILGIVASVGYKIWYQYELSHRPPVEEKPEVKFGTLPKVLFPSSNISSSNYSYSIDTVTGGLPQTPKLAKVYFIPQTGISLLAPDKAKRLAENLGFPNGQEILSQTRHKFTDNQNGSLTIDLSTGNFHFQRSVATDSALLQKIPFSDKDQVIGNFRSYLASKGLLIEDIQKSRAEVVFDSPSPVQSQTAQVSIWPSDLDNLPIVTANLHRGLIGGTLTQATDEKNKVTKVDYTFWSIDKTTFSTYPLKTAEQALSDLRAGLGFINTEPEKPQVSISSIYLGYLESEDYSPYLQPVFVFEGPGFSALVPAIAK